MASSFSVLKQLVMKMHFIVGLLMFVFIALMVVENDITVRALLLVPVVICYSLSKILFSMDQAAMVEDMVSRKKR